MSQGPIYDLERYGGKFNAFFNIRLTNANANSQNNQPVKTILKKNEKEKKRAYDSRIINVNMGHSIH